MPLDAIMITALTAELSDRICGARIDKVQQPAGDLIILTLRCAGNNLRLLISGGGGVARVHLTDETYENPRTAPMFCMLLRKHVQGARIASVTQPQGERMILLGLDCYDEMGEAARKQIAFEMLGRSSNIILVGADGIIIDCLRRVDAEMSPARQVLPGMLYRLPPKQEKADFLAVGGELRRQMWGGASGDALTDKWLLDSFSGVSPLICREISYLSCGEGSKRICALTPAEREGFAREMDALADRVDCGELTPVMLLRDGAPADLSFMTIAQYESAVSLETFPSFSELLDAFYSRREKTEQMRRRSQSLLKSVRSAHERAQRKLTARRHELEKTAQRDYNRRCGDLITANIYRIKKGDRVLEAEDYYSAGCPTIRIELDPLKTPQQNAARYYREYNKAKTAEKYLGDLIEKGEREEAYLAAVMDEISRAESESDIAAIRRELTETGFIRAPKAKTKEKYKQAEPLRFMSSAGMEILVGRNNVQNDELTTKLSRRTDVWLHVQKIHGSHVIISCKGAEPNDKTLREAASLAVYHSQNREGGKTPVDYTQVRFVRKPAGAMPGMVTYTDYKTIIAEPDEALAERLRVK